MLGLGGLALMGPFIAIAASGRLEMRERMLWALTTLAPIFLAAGLWLLFYYIIKPAAEARTAYTAVAGLIAIWGPWLVFAAFKKRAARGAR